MNRIYQGRVSKVLDVAESALPVTPKPSEGGWQHHELFQDAVNF